MITILPDEQAAPFSQQPAEGIPGFFSVAEARLLDAMLEEIQALPLEQVLVARCRDQSKQLDRYVANQRRVVMTD